MVQKPVVYVSCATYNHAPYIRRCLDGFVMQKTSFPFRVIVHDDASTDGTTEIVREYKNKYPELFYVIIQETNKYSTGVKIGEKYINPLLDGKYVATCEGDDCWTSADKLQKQYDYMESHPECSICVHNAVFVDEGKKIERIYPNESNDKDFSIDEVIIRGAGLFATNSFFVRTEYYVNRPSCFYCPGVGDYQIVMYATINGSCHFLSDVMSRYNFGVQGSWTERVWKNKTKRIIHFVDMVTMLHRVDKEYNRKYRQPISVKIKQLESEIYTLLDDHVHFSNEEKAKVLTYIVKHALLRSRIYPVYRTIKKLLMRTSLSKNKRLEKTGTEERT